MSHISRCRCQIYDDDDEDDDDDYDDDYDVMMMTTIIPMSLGGIVVARH